MVETAVIALLVTILSALSGLVWSGFRDNFCQSVGLAGICWAAGMRIDRILDTHRVSEVAVIFYVSLALYFAGTAWKAWRRNHPKMTPPARQ